MSKIMEQTSSTILIDLEFLDHQFKLEVTQNIDLEELLEIIEKFILETPSISIDLKVLSKTLLDTEYYNLILKQKDQLINQINEIKIGIPLRLEMESDTEKKRYFTKKHLKSTLKHIDSISISEFVKMFQINNLPLFKINLQKLEENFLIKIVDDVIYLVQPMDNNQIKEITDKILASMD